MANVIAALASFPRQLQIAANRVPDEPLIATAMVAAHRLVFRSNGGLLSRSNGGLQLLEFRTLYFGELPVTLPFIVEHDDARVVLAYALGWGGQFALRARLRREQHLIGRCLRTVATGGLRETRCGDERRRSGQ
jgi:hypothetical protein